MARLRDNPNSLDALVAATADTLGIDAAFVEKDFWVIEVLRAATREVTVLAKDGRRHPVQTIFKGGTSLSRVYGLIERFSEDETYSRHTSIESTPQVAKAEQHH